jgi:hypothetical protein
MKIGKEFLNQLLKEKVEKRKRSDKMGDDRIGGAFEHYQSNEAGVMRINRVYLKKELKEKLTSLANIGELYLKTAPNEVKSLNLSLNYQS